MRDMEVAIERARQARKSADTQQEIAWELLAKAKQAAKKRATKRLDHRKRKNSIKRRKDIV